MTDFLLQVFLNDDLCSMILEQLDFADVTNFTEALPSVKYKFEHCIAKVFGHNNYINCIYLTNFKNIKSLNLPICNLTEIDLSDFRKLEQLNLSFNKLTEIKLGDLVSLKKLDLSYNSNLKHLNVRKNKKLLELNICVTSINKIKGLNKKRTIVDKKNIITLISRLYNQIL